MTSGASEPPPGTRGFAAYERATVERFFAEAVEERARLLAEIASVRRRIADAKAALAAINEMQYACIGSVIEAQRALRDEKRATERAIAAMHASVEAQVEQLVHEAGARIRAFPDREPPRASAAARNGAARHHGVNGDRSDRPAASSGQ